MLLYNAMSFDAAATQTKYFLSDLNVLHLNVLIPQAAQSESLEMHDTFSNAIQSAKVSNAEK